MGDLFCCLISTLVSVGATESEHLAKRLLIPSIDCDTRGLSPRSGTQPSNRKGAQTAWDSLCPETHKKGAGHLTFKTSVSFLFTWEAGEIIPASQRREAEKPSPRSHSWSTSGFEGGSSEAETNSFCYLGAWAPAPQTQTLNQ